jgi:hypothetical protein
MPNKQYEKCLGGKRYSSLFKLFIQGNAAAALQTVKSLGRGFVIHPIAFVELSDKIAEAVTEWCCVANIKASATEDDDKANEISAADKKFKSQCSKVALVVKKRLFPPNTYEWGKYTQEMEPIGFNGVRYCLMLGESIR